MNDILRVVQMVANALLLLALSWLVFTMPVKAQDEFDCGDFGGIDLTNLFLPFAEEDEDDIELVNIILDKIPFKFIIDSKVADWDVKVFDIIDTNGVFIVFKDEQCVILYMKPKVDKRATA